MKALQELERLAQETKRSNYPKIPDHALPKSKFKDDSANGLTKAILTWLTLNGHYCSRIQSQGQWNQKLGIFTKSTVRKGIGDIMAIIEGRTVMIEVKVGKDRLSPAQIETAEEVERSKGLYWPVRSFDEFMIKYKEVIQDPLAGTPSAQDSIILDSSSKVKE